MKINILLFGPLGQALGRKKIAFELLGNKSDVGAIVELVCRDYPQIKRELIRVAVNQEICGNDKVIKEGDEIAFLPPISGGADLYLTRRKITPEYIKRVTRSSSSNCGSVLTFSGLIRNDTKTKNQKAWVQEIEYSVYANMAEKEIIKIIESAKKRFKVADVIVKHRIGTVKVGEIAFFVAVFSPHRKEGIAAIDFIIDQVKSKVPIWKKEIYSDGEESWQSGAKISK